MARAAALLPSQSPFQLEVRLLPSLSLGFTLRLGDHDRVEPGMPRNRQCQCRRGRRRHAGPPPPSAVPVRVRRAGTVRVADSESVTQ
jgi:hypothetical protein